MLDTEKLNFIKRFNHTKTSKILHADYDPKHNPEFATELKGQVQSLTGLASQEMAG